MSLLQKTNKHQHNNWWFNNLESKHKKMEASIQRPPFFFVTMSIKFPLNHLRKLRQKSIQHQAQIEFAEIIDDYMFL